MHISKKSARGNDIIPVEVPLADARHFYMTGEIDTEMAQEFFKAMSYFAMEDPEEPVKVFINSHGGSVEAGMMIYDIIQGAPMPVKMYCTQMAYSMAAIIFASGNDGRYILPHSKMMIHEPIALGGINGKTSSIRKTSERMCQLKSELDAILAKHTGQSVEIIDKATSEDCYCTAGEAVAFGLADEVIDFKEMIE